jgi:hypothetical protein
MKKHVRKESRVIRTEETEEREPTQEGKDEEQPKSVAAYLFAITKGVLFGV